MPLVGPPGAPRNALPLYAQSTQRDALVDFYVIADIGGLTDDDPGAVIDEEPRSDARARVNVDPRLAMRVLGDDARDHRHVLLVQNVGDAVRGDGADARVRKDDLLDAGRGGIALVRRQDV